MDEGCLGDCFRVAVMAKGRRRMNDIVTDDGVAKVGRMREMERAVGGWNVKDDVRPCSS
jgi:hypothetical protein